MPSPILVKGVTCLSVVGLVSAGSLYFGTDIFTKKKSIASLIKDLRKDKRVITSDSVTDPAWKVAGKKYREENNSREKDIWGLAGGSKSSEAITEVDAIPTFLKACKDNSNKKVVDSEDPLYKVVESYCTRDAVVADLILENNTNKRLLKDSDAGSTKGWKDAGALYKKGNTNKWGLSDGSSHSGKDDAPDSFKNKCKEQLAVKVGVSGSIDYKDTLNGCTENNG